MPNDYIDLTPETAAKEITRRAFRIYTEPTSDRGGIWAFKPFAMVHACWVSEQDYHAALDRAEAELTALRAAAEGLNDALAETSAILQAAVVLGKVRGGDSYRVGGSIC